MRAFIIAPADMYPDLLLGQAVQRMIQRGNMAVRNRDKFIITEISKQHMTRQGKVRAVKLKVKTRINNRFIFCPHYLRQRVQIMLAAGVIIILQEQRDHSGRGRVHKAALYTMGGHRCFQIGNILVQFTIIQRRDLACAHWPGIGRGAAAICQTLKEAGELFEVCGRVARAVP